MLSHGLFSIKTLKKSQEPENGLLGFFFSLFLTGIPAIILRAGMGGGCVQGQMRLLNVIIPSAEGFL